MKVTDRNWIVRLGLLVVALSVIPMAGAQEAAVQEMLDEDAISRRRLREDLVPEAVDGRFQLPTLSAPSTTVTIEADREMPPDFRGDEPQPVEPLPESGSQREASWGWTVKPWEAPNTFSNPRYFEDRMLERHGHEYCGHFQPVISGARFFLTVPMLPYLMAVNEPCDCEYTLGYYRPGSCTPAFVQRPPYDRRAAVTQALVTAGVMIGFP